MADRLPLGLTGADAALAGSTDVDRVVVDVAVAVVVYPVADFVGDWTTAAAGVEYAVVDDAIAVVVKAVADLVRGGQLLCGAGESSQSEIADLIAVDTAGPDALRAGLTETRDIVDCPIAVVVEAVACFCTWAGLQDPVLADSHVRHFRAVGAVANDIAVVVDGAIAVVVEVVAGLDRDGTAEAAGVLYAFVGLAVAVVVGSVADLGRGDAGRPCVSRRIYCGVGELRVDGAGVEHRICCGVGWGRGCVGRKAGVDGAANPAFVDLPVAVVVGFVADLDG